MKLKMGMKISTKIILSIVLVVVLLGSASAIYVNRFTLKNLSKMNEEQLVYHVQNHAGMIADEMQRSENMSKYIAETKEIADFLSKTGNETEEEVSTLLNNFNNKNNFSAIYLLSATGTAVVSTDPSFVGVNYGMRKYFKDTLEGKTGAMMAIGITSKKPGYYFARPIEDSSGNFLGAVVVKDSSEYFDNIISSNTFAGHVTMLVDSNGVIIASNSQSRVFKSLGNLSGAKLAEINDANNFPGIDIKPLGYDLILKAVLDYKEPITINIFDDLDKEHETLAVARVAEFPYFLVLETETEMIQDAAYSAAFTVAFLVFAAVFFVVVLVVFIIRKFLKPIDSLKQMATKIGSGNFSQKNEIKTKDELFELGDVLEKVSKQLSDLYGKLEEKVKERTKQLEKSNQELIKSQENLEKEKEISEILANDLLKFKLAADNAFEHIVITDPEGNVIYGNKTMEKVTGYSVQESIGKKAGTLWKYPMPPEYYKNLWKVIKVDKKVFEGEIINRRKNGEVYEAHISISPVLDKNNEIIYFVGLERDITIEKNIDRAKTEFVSLASHQLRTPLTTVSWYAEILASPDSGKLSKKQKEYLKEIYDGNKRMIDLVNALLNVSRIELGTFAIEPKEIKIEDIYRSVIKDLAPEIKQKKIKIEDNKDEKIGNLLLDEKLIRIVFQNLITNSVKYIGKKGVINIDLKKTAKNIEVSVADNGIGIPKAEQAKIFSKLFRASNAMTVDSKGTGLGLYIVKSIVEEAGGKIWFESEENHGTTFYFTIPLGGMKPKQGSRPLS